MTACSIYLLMTFIKGMLAARGDFLLMVDADGATRFSDLQKLESEMKQLMKKSVRN